jgi:hypothetical protein
MGISRGLSGNGALSSINLLKNQIPVEQAQELVTIMQAKALASVLKEHPILRSLCGSSGEETELNMKGQKIGVEGAIMLAPEIAGNGARSQDNEFPLLISTVIVNTFPLPIQDIKAKAELDFSGKKLKAEDAIIIAALIPSNVGRTIFPHPC